jgi:hypothetical protein
MFAYLPRWLTGGRPMRYLKTSYVAINGDVVALYEDRYGRKWLAKSAWDRERSALLFLDDEMWSEM